jgi:uncharacterized membrane protein
MAFVAMTILWFYHSRITYIIIERSRKAMGNFGMFSINTFLTNLNTNFQFWAGIIVTIIGAIVMLVGIWKIGKGFMSDRAQTNWVMAIGAILLGGVMMLGGWSLFKNTGNDISRELQGYGGTYIINTLFK